MTKQSIQLVVMRVNGLVAKSRDDVISAMPSDVVVAQCEAFDEANLSLQKILFARSVNEVKGKPILFHDPPE